MKNPSLYLELKFEMEPAKDEFFDEFDTEHVDVEKLLIELDTDISKEEDEEESIIITKFPSNDSITLKKTETEYKKKKNKTLDKNNHTIKTGKRKYVRKIPKPDTIKSENSIKAESFFKSEDYMKTENEEEKNDPIKNENSEFSENSIIKEDSVKKEKRKYVRKVPKLEIPEKKKLNGELSKKSKISKTPEKTSKILKQKFKIGQEFLLTDNSVDQMKNNVKIKLCNMKPFLGNKVYFETILMKSLNKRLDKNDKSSNGIPKSETKSFTKMNGPKKKNVHNGPALEIVVCDLKFDDNEPKSPSKTKSKPLKSILVKSKKPPHNRKVTFCNSIFIKNICIESETESEFNSDSDSDSDYRG